MPDNPLPIWSDCLMKITVLGCGTSFGVPMIACDCQVCTSAHPRNKRMRSSILVGTGGKNVLVDTTTDLRLQALANGIRHIDAVLYTHPHAEHMNGIDELRRFNIVQGTGIPCYGSPETLEEMRQIFRYIFLRPGRPGWQPDLSMHPVTGPFELFGVEVTPIPLIHGSLPVYGYRFGEDFAYLTDFSEMPGSSKRLLAGVKVAVMEALRPAPHPSHLTVEAAVTLAGELGFARTFFTHMAHEMDYEPESARLPKGMELAHDGLVIEV